MPTTRSRPTPGGPATWSERLETQGGQVVGPHHGLACRGRAATGDLEVGTRIRLAQHVQPRVPVRVLPGLELRGGLLEVAGGDGLELGPAGVRHRRRGRGVGRRLEGPGQSGGCRRGLPDARHQVGARRGAGEGRPEHRRPHGERREQQHADRQQEPRPQATQHDRGQARPVARTGCGLAARSRRDVPRRRGPSPRQRPRPGPTRPLATTRVRCSTRRGRHRRSPAAVPAAGGVWPRRLRRHRARHAHGHGHGFQPPGAPPGGDRDADAAEGVLLHTGRPTNARHHAESMTRSRGGSRRPPARPGHAVAPTRWSDPVPQRFGPRTSVDPPSRRSPHRASRREARRRRARGRPRTGSWATLRRAGVDPPMSLHRRPAGVPLIAPPPESDSRRRRLWSPGTAGCRRRRSATGAGPESPAGRSAA